MTYTHEHLAAALTWIEQNERGGIAIVAEALAATCPPEPVVVERPAPGDPTRLTVIIARERREFENWCRSFNFNPRSKLFVVDCDDGRGGQRLRGIDGRKADLWFVGTYYERRDIADVRELLRFGRFADADR